ncbi:MAG: DUF1512 family protein, partial [Candidatus Thorarchaeota archaeon]
MIQMQLPGLEGEFTGLINIVFLVFIIMMSLYGARIQMWQWLKQIEAGLVELEQMKKESTQ